MSTAEVICGFLGGGVLLGVFTLMGVMLHTAYTKEGVILEHFKNSSVSGPMKYNGLMGKLVFISGAMAIVTFPRIHLKHRRVSAEDLKNFPASLKRKLVILQWIGIVLVSSLFLIWGIGRIVGWL
jgi:hypothetical protein